MIIKIESSIAAGCDAAASIRLLLETAIQSLDLCGVHAETILADPEGDPIGKLTVQVD